MNIAIAKPVVCFLMTLVFSLPGSAFGQQTDEPKQIPEVGVTAPEIAGETLDGDMANLSDYRGRIVLLWFWGHWCPPCRAMLPQLWALDQNLDEESFVIIGVNSDPDPQAIRDDARPELVTWISFRNEQDDNSISDSWNVKGWPTVFIIDPEGRIRFVNVRGEKLNRAVAELLEENELEYPEEAIESDMAKVREDSGK